MSSKTTVYLLLLFAVSVWGMSFVWTGQLLSFGFPVNSLVFFRLLIAFVFLFILSTFSRKLERVKAKDIGLFFLLALFEPFLYFIGETYGIQRSSPTLASVIVSTIPLFIPIAAYYFYKERVSSGNFLGIMVSVAGVCLVIFHKGSDTGLSLSGLLLLLLAILSAVLYSSVIKRLTDSYNPYTIVTYQNLIGALYFLPFFLFFDLKDFRQLQLSWEQIRPLVLLSILASSLAFVCFVHAIKVLGMTRANTFATLIPVLTALFAFMLGTEELSLLCIVGIITVVVGLVLSQRRSAKKPPQLLNELG